MGVNPTENEARNQMEAMLQVESDLAIAFQRTVFRVGVKGHNPETVAKRMQLRDQLQALTKRGPKEKEAVN